MIPYFSLPPQLIFTGEYTIAMNKSWHLGHFRCNECDISITGKQFIVREEKPVCIECFDQRCVRACAMNATARNFILESQRGKFRLTVRVLYTYSLFNVLVFVRRDSNQVTMTIAISLYQTRFLAQLQDKPNRRIYSRRRVPHICFHMECEFFIKEMFILIYSLSSSCLVRVLNKTLGSFMREKIRRHSAHLNCCP